MDSNRGHCPTIPRPSIVELGVTCVDVVKKKKEKVKNEDIVSCNLSTLSPYVGKIPEKKDFYHVTPDLKSATAHDQLECRKSKSHYPHLERSPCELK